MNHDSLMKEAKILVGEINNLNEILYQKQMRLAEICINLCTIKKGNFRNKGKYNLKNFANDLNIPKSSLKQWVDTFNRIIPIIGKEAIKSSKDWIKAKKICAKYPQKSRYDQNEIKESFSDEIAPAKIELFESIENSRKIMKFLKNRELSILNKQQLLSLMVNLDSASDIINDFLTKEGFKYVH
jgi:hypothetical protein